VQSSQAEGGGQVNDPLPKNPHAMLKLGAAIIELQRSPVRI
jgi:hypothetical protein